ncbi:hypothetical protein AWC38_SpisGene13588 [Stylophora pistillata]|uniref:Uncharacterized protein n=1 Tax=Stylophora pistillata TaxID=50429 RepID=A0A2B4RXN9_STYPI|nr:hypothetical protein AWC38_SpisGene13588 [Stylophora pistillata]
MTCEDVMTGEDVMTDLVVLKRTRVALKRAVVVVLKKRFLIRPPSNDHEYSEGVMQLFPADVLLIEDKAVIAQMYVLVASVSSIRMYRHSEGHIHLVAREKKMKADLDACFDSLSEMAEDLDTVDIEMLNLYAKSSNGIFS